MASVAAIIQELPGTYRERLSAFTIERRGGRWYAILTYALVVPTNAGTEAGPYAITVESRDLPPGITLSGHVRVADSIHALVLRWQERIDPQAEVHAMLRAVHKSGVVGALDIARFDSGGAPHWIVKTHAGSDAERAAWLRSIS